MVSALSLSLSFSSLLAFGELFLRFSRTNSAGWWLRGEQEVSLPSKEDACSGELGVEHEEEEVSVRSRNCSSSLPEEISFFLLSFRRLASFGVGDLSDFSSALSISFLAFPDFTLSSTWPKLLPFLLTVLDLSSFLCLLLFSSLFRSNFAPSEICFEGTAWLVELSDFFFFLPPDCTSKFQAVY